MKYKILVILLLFYQTVYAGFDVGNGGRIFSCELDSNSVEAKNIKETLKYYAKKYDHTRFNSPGYKSERINNYLKIFIDLQKRLHTETQLMDFWYFKNHVQPSIRLAKISCETSFYQQLENLNAKQENYRSCEIGHAIMALQVLKELLPQSEKSRLHKYIYAMIDQMTMIVNYPILNNYMFPTYTPDAEEYLKYDNISRQCKNPKRQSRQLPVGFFRGDLWIINYGLFFALNPTDRFGFLIHEVVFRFLNDSFVQYDFKLEDVFILTSLLSSEEINKNRILETLERLRE